MASVRARGKTSKESITINGKMLVGNLENKFMDELGVKVQIEDKGGKLANNSVSLSSLNKSEQKTTSKLESTPSAEDKGKGKGCLIPFLLMGSAFFGIIMIIAANL